MPVTRVARVPEKGELTLQNIQTDATKLVDIRMENLCQEPDFGRRHGVIVG